MKKIVCLLGFILISLYCKAYYHPWFTDETTTPVLYWMSSDSATVDDIPIATFIDPYYYEDEGGNGYDAAVRVKVTGGDLLSPTFLSIYVGDGQSWDGTDGMSFMEDIGGYWGSGVPVGNQSSMIDGLTRELLDEYVFQMELGMYDESQDWAFVTLAVSDPKTFQQLDEAGYIYRTFDLGPNYHQAWNPNFYTHPPIPEPSIPLLMLIGVGLLGLRRVNIKN